MTTSPKNLQQVQNQEWVIRVNNGMIEGRASLFFKDVFNDERHVFCRKLFTEDGYNVWECFTDSGSVDYLYIISKS
jgi:hypothetical protein